MGTLGMDGNFVHHQGRRHRPCCNYYIISSLVAPPPRNYCCNISRACSYTQGQNVAQYTYTHNLYFESMCMIIVHSLSLFPPNPSLASLIYTYDNYRATYK